MKKWQLSVLSITLASIAGCSSVGMGSKQVDYRGGASVAPSLEVPPEMSTPATDDRFKVPQADSSGIATYSSYNQKQPASAVAASNPAVLPTVKGVHLERNGTQRWLVVEDKAENVWPTVKTFLQETGLTLKTEDPATGVLETNWAENRAKIPQEGLRSLVGKVFDNLYSSGQRDQFLVRLERSKDGNRTEIYLTHHGMEEVLAEDRNTSKWQARPADPELEAIMLQRLMVRLGGSPAQAQAIVADEVAKTPVGSGEAKLQEIYDGSQIILIRDNFEHSWRRVGLAIEKSGFIIEDKDRASGVYLLRRAKVEESWADKLKFWQDKPDMKARYRVTVKENNGVSEVSAGDQDGTSTEDSRALVESLYKNLAP